MVSKSQLEESDIDIMVGASQDSIVMVEGEFDEISEEEMTDAIKFAHEEIKRQIDAQKKLVKQAGISSEKREYEGAEEDQELESEISEKVYQKSYDIAKKGLSKNERSELFGSLKDELVDSYDEDTLEEKKDLIIKYFNKAQKKAVRDLVLNEGIRLDGRKTESIRDIWTEVGYLPSTHGSAVFNQDNFLDENFSILRLKFEMVGNLFNELLRPGNLNSNNKVEISNILPSQYTKAEINYIKHILLNNGNVFAFRAFTGIAIPYGNSNYIPFTRSYYAGGSNDNRAWKAYKLGPGSSNNINEFNEANFKISLNFEYRNKISGKLNGAFFVDIGNIWNVNDNIEDDSMTFDNFSDLNELAVGSGFGLRYDFNFFVLRLDTAFKTYNPARVKNQRWFSDFSLNKAVFNIGINYPF